MKSRRCCEGYASRLTFGGPQNTIVPGWQAKEYLSIPTGDGVVGHVARPTSGKEMPAILPQPIPSSQLSLLPAPTSQINGNNISAVSQTQQLQHSAPSPSLNGNDLNRFHFSHPPIDDFSDKQNSIPYTAAVDASKSLPTTTFQKSELDEHPRPHHVDLPNLAQSDQLISKNTLGSLDSDSITRISKYYPEMTAFTTHSRLPQKKCLTEWRNHDQSEDPKLADVDNELERYRVQTMAQADNVRHILQGQLLQVWKGKR